MENQLKVVAYARVSSREQADKDLSIPAQLKAIRKYCQDKGWKLVAEYIDAGKSAKTDERPEFQKMIALAKKQNRHFDAIVIHKYDRFSRNRDDHVIYKSLLKKIGVLVYSVTEQADPETPHGFLLEGIMEVISEFYNMNLKNEVFKGMKENARRGFHNGGVAPYGYRLNKISTPSNSLKTILVPGPDEEVKTVKNIFHMYVYEGYGYKKIASFLNVENIPSSTGGLWSYSSIHAILHNEIYIGNSVWNKHDYSTGKKVRPEGDWIRQINTHVALISQEVFNQVKEKSKTRIKNSSLFEATSSPFILRGLFKCPFCGANMVSGQSGGRGGSRNVRRYYICGLYQRKGKVACKFKSFGKEQTEGLVISAVVKEFTLLSMDKMLAEELTKYNHEKNKEVTFKLQNIENEIQLTKMRIDLLLKEIASEEKPAKLKSYLKDSEQRLSELHHSNELLNQTISNNVLNTEVIDIVRNKLKNFTAVIISETPDQQNMMLKKYIKSINYNLATNILTIQLFITSPSDSDAVIFEKQLFVSV